MGENEDFRCLILRICERISDLESLKYQCKDDIGRGKMEKIKTAMELFTVLEERDRVSAENVDFLVTILTNIRRKDLAKHVQAYKNKWLPNEILTMKTFTDFEEPAKLNAVPFTFPQVNQPPPQYRHTVHGNEPHYSNEPTGAVNNSQAIDPQTLSLIHFVSERLSHNWQLLARYLSIPDGVIDQSIHTYPNVRQQVVESLLWWARYGHGTITEMINAARRSERMDLADEIEMNFPL